MILLPTYSILGYTTNMYIAVDIGGTKTLVALLDESQSIVKKERFPTNPDYPLFRDQLFATITTLAPDMSEILAIGVAVPGVLDYDTEHVRAFGNLPWKDCPIKHELVTKFNKPTAIDNDGNMGALGEAVLGAGKGYDVVAYITISTGIGTGFVHNSEIDPTLAKSEAGMMHFKHDGQNMLWEKFASGKAFVERFGAQGKDIDDPAIWHEYAQDIAIGFGCIIALIQPDVIVIGGSMGVHIEKYRSFLLDALQEVRSPLTPLPQIVQAKDSEQAVIYGCYEAARRYADTH